MRKITLDEIPALQSTTGERIMMPLSRHQGIENDIVSYPEPALWFDASRRPWEYGIRPCACCPRWHGFALPAPPTGAFRAGAGLPAMSTAGRALLGVVEWQHGVIREKNRLINLLCPGPDQDAGKDRAVENGPGTMGGRSESGRQSQMTLLRLELVRANREIDAARVSWAAEVGILVAKERQLVERLDERDLTVSALEVDLKDAKRQLAVHENYNNPSSKATLYTERRREYGRKSKAMREGATHEEVEEAGKSKERRGKRAGADGTTPAYKPDKSKTVQFVQDMCGMCGRTDTVLMNYVWKIVVDIGECGKVVCYVEKIAPAYCGVCSVITWPATNSIPGTWAGPNLRRIIMNIHEVAYTVWAISRLLKSNHYCIMSAGAVSNCIYAMA